MHRPGQKNLIRILPTGSKERGVLGFRGIPVEIFLFDKI